MCLEVWAQNQNKLKQSARAEVPTDDHNMTSVLCLALFLSVCLCVSLMLFDAVYPSLCLSLCLCPSLSLSVSVGQKCARVCKKCPISDVLPRPSTRCQGQSDNPYLEVKQVSEIMSKCVLELHRHGRNARTSFSKGHQKIIKEIINF